MTRIIHQKKPPYLHLPPLLDPRDRVSIWEKVRGMWKHRKPDPLIELKKMRREWERVSPSFK